MRICKSAICKSFFLFFLISILAGCGGGEEVSPTQDQAEIDDGIIQTYLTDNNITATKDPSGIYFIPVVENSSGTTQQVSGSILSIYYSVSVLNGQVIDEVLAAQGEDPYKLKQGVNAIVPVGLDTGLALMREGETYTFIIPSGLAFGELSFSTLIPSNSIIEIDVELVEILNEADQLLIETGLIDDYIVDNQLNDLTTNPTDSVRLRPSGIYYKKIDEGLDGETVESGASISVSYIGSFLNDDVFDRTNGNATFNFTFDSNQVIEGFDLGIAEMEIGERALIIMPSQYAYGPSVGIVPSLLADDLVEMQVIPGYASAIGPYEVLVFDITLL